VQTTSQKGTYLVDHIGGVGKALLLKQISQHDLSSTGCLPHHSHMIPHLADHRIYRSAVSISDGPERKVQRGLGLRVYRRVRGRGPNDTRYQQIPRIAQLSWKRIPRLLAIFPHIFKGPLLFPWKIIADAKSFLTFLSSYAVFLMPICGIMVVDYWLVRRGNLHVPSLYSRDADAPYTYWKGWNLRAIVAWLAGTGFVIHGVAGALEPSLTNQASKDMYKLGFLLSFLVGSTVYYVACLIFPVPMYPASKQDTPKTFEYMAASEGFFEGESVDTIRLSHGAITGIKPNGDMEKDSAITSEKEIVYV
jgi:hypothetical protein